MSSEAIQELQCRISLCQNKVDEIQKEIIELSKKREALFSLENANNRRISDFHDLHQKQRNSLDRLSSIYTIRYSEGHKRHLSSHISGSPFSLVDSSLGEVTQMLKRGITR